MRSRSPILAITAVAAITVLVACTPDENEPVLQTTAEVKTTASPSGNYLAGRQAQINRDFGSASRFLGQGLKESRKIRRYSETPSGAPGGWGHFCGRAHGARDCQTRENRGNPQAHSSGRRG